MVPVQYHGRLSPRTATSPAKMLARTGSMAGSFHDGVRAAAALKTTDALRAVAGAVSVQVASSGCSNPDQSRSRCRATPQPVD